MSVLLCDDSFPIVAKSLLECLLIQYQVCGLDLHYMAHDRTFLVDWLLIIRILLAS